MLTGGACHPRFERIIKFNPGRVEHQKLIIKITTTISMSKTRLIVHIVFSTKHRRPTIPQEHKRDLYRYIYGIIKNKNCFLHRMNGMSDHVHILVDVNATIAVASLVKEIKQASSHWLKANPDFPNFAGWNEGYYAVTVGMDGLESCVSYIKNQELHHQGSNLIDEVRSMAERFDIQCIDDDWN